MVSGDENESAEMALPKTSTRNSPLSREEDPTVDPKITDPKATDPKATESLSFEAAFKRLQEIVQNIEKGEQNLEASLKNFEEGVQLTRICQQSLQTAELKVQQLLKVTTEGHAETKPFGNG